MLFGENGTGTAIADYTARAPYIIAQAVGQLWKLNELYCEAHGLTPPAAEETRAYIPLTETFPLETPFARAIMLYLGSMLVVEENAELSDDLFDKFSMAAAAITAQIPATRKEILDKYGY